MTAVMDHPEQRPSEPPRRPAWTLTADQTLTELDDLHQAQTRLTARRLELLHHLDTLGHARNLGARDTVELLSLRHRLDPQTVRRDLKTALALPRHTVLAGQLPGYPPTGTGDTSATDLDRRRVTDPDEPIVTDSDRPRVTKSDRPCVTDGDGTGVTDCDGRSGDGRSGDGGGDHDGSTDPAAATSVVDSVEVLVDRRRAAQAREVTLNSVQAAVIAETLAKVPAHVAAADVALAETELVIAARTLLPRDLRRLGRAVVDRLDTDGPAPADTRPDEQSADDAAQAAQSLWFAPGSVTSPIATAGRVKGLRFGGFLSNENAELFQTLIDAAAKPRKTPTGELDPRTLGQRRADALSTVLRAAASTGGEIPAHGGIKPHLSVTIPYTTLTTLTADSPFTIASSRTLAAPPRASALTPVPPPHTATQPDPAAVTSASTSLAAAQTLSLPGAPTAGLALSARAPTAADLRTDLTRLGNLASSAGELVFGDPLSAAEVRRIACDAGIIPIVLGTQSEPLDVGREHRLVTPAIRRALIARDGGCVIPGCDAPPGHCDAHHLVHWVDGGITAVSNLALVCRPHHRAIHRGVWTVTIVDGQVRINRPAWSDPGPSG